MTRAAGIVLLAALLVLAFVPTPAAGRKTKGTSERWTNTSHRDKDDFHVQLCSTDTIQNVGAKINDGGVLHFPDETPTCDPPVGGVYCVNIHWTGLDIPSGDKFQWNATWKKGNVYVRAFLTPQYHAPVGPALGLDVDDDGDASLTNATDDDMWYADLEYTVMPDSLPLTGDEILEMMSYSSEGNPFLGYGTDWVDLSDGSVPTSGETYLATVDLQEGEYLYCFHSCAYAAVSDTPNYSLKMHQHPSSASATEESTWGRIKTLFSRLIR